jgi:two-component system alkaline phosphatase synthesis response regulator PhoP
MGHKILIVDDEIHIRLLMEQILEDLEEEGVEILTAADGQEGLEVIRAERPALVFLDVMMPRMNGFDVCRTVKHDLQMKDTRVIMLTAKGQEYDRQMGEEAGADLYMTKPFDPDEVLEKARMFLNLQQ